MNTKYLEDLLEKFNSYNKLYNALKDKETPIEVYGLANQGIGLINYGLESSLERPILIVTYDIARAHKLYEDLIQYFNDGIYLFPARELFFFNRDARSNELLKQRLETMEAMLTNQVNIVVTTMEALQGYYLKPDIFKSEIFSLKIGDLVDLNELIKKLIFLGYERVSLVEGMGQFSIRGDIIDIYPPSPNPYRIELFDIEVDGIRSFDIKTQRAIETCNSVTISPVKDILISKETSNQMAKAMDEDLEQVKKLGDLEELRARDKFLPYIEKLKQWEYVKNPDLILPYLPKEICSLIIDYFIEDPIVMIDEPRRIDEVNEAINQDLFEQLTNLVGTGELLKSHMNIQWSQSEVEEHLKNRDIVVLNSIIKSNNKYIPEHIVNFDMRTITSFNGRIKQFKEELQYYLDEKYSILILGGNQAKADRLGKTLTEFGFPVERVKQDLTHLKSGIVYVDTGHLQGGFIIDDIKFALFNAGEIYGSKPSKKKRRTKKKDLIKIDDLTVGDYMVHESHGVGKYMGTSQLEVQGVTKDYLSIQYKGGDKLFLPMDQLHLIHKYIGKDGKRPKLNKLNSTTWKKTTSKAKRSVEEMAEDLIELYAEREKIEGYTFSKDTPWQKDFEDAFPYEETEGQLESVKEIKQDMEKPQPMDRLLCADVGFGKTEVALRAAFKAIMDGKQVAFLVPTTILAQQHFNTIMERFSDFPARIAMLSRFRTPSQQAKDIEGLRIGSVDLVIGTHRLLSKDVKFKDLGLLIIDEEQRFGVRHKERLKAIKKNVDTLTLTATPIPRTLQMSMVGIRDISVIYDPPEERFPVQTYVVEYNDIMIREIILKEIERGGQVYFVYNRVQSMEQMLNRLRKLIPEVSIAMANGQMNERNLEDTMISFVNHEIDVLLCSTIIETGMDVSNANTMIIWEANLLGLSQLYQLRGRIGRSNRVAYAYFTYRKDASISEVAEKRLQAIREFTEFGSGFQIALRDLEIRGSGNILGESQHGHMEAIGYDLYIKFLSKAVNRLKGLEEKEPVDTTVDILEDAFLPKAYIRDEGIRMEIYRKIVLIETDEDELDLIDELIDRFGEPPRVVMNLIKISKLRNLASSLEIESIIQNKNQLVITFIKTYEMELSMVNELTQKFGKKLTFSLGSPNQLMLKSSKKTLEDLREILYILNLHKFYTKKSS